MSHSHAIVPYTLQRGQSLTQALGWDVESRPVFDASGHQIQDAQQLVRSDTGAHLVTAKASYTPITHADVDAVVRGLLSGLADTAEVSARTWDGGRSLAVSIRVDSEHVTRALNVPSDPSGRQLSILVRSAHDGSAALRIMVALGRILCSNGLVAPDAFRLGRATIRHTANAHERLIGVGQDAARQLTERVEQIGSTLRALASRSLDRSQVGTAVREIVGVEDTIKQPRLATVANRIIELVQSADGSFVPRPNAGQEHNALQVLEAVTAYDRHFSRREGAAVRLLEGRALGAKAWDVLASGVK